MQQHIYGLMQQHTYGLMQQHMYACHGVWHEPGGVTNMLATLIYARPACAGM